VTKNHPMPLSWGSLYPLQRVKRIKGGGKTLGRKATVRSVQKYVLEFRIQYDGSRQTTTCRTPDEFTSLD